MARQKIEKEIVLLFNQHQSKLLDRFSAIISSVLFLVVAWTLIAAVVLVHNFLAGIFICIGLVIVFLLHFVISEGILKGGAKIFSLQRTRPYRAYPDEIRAIGRKFSDSSFPSSHLASMVGGLVILVSFYGFMLWPAVLVTLLMSWSRLRNGMHYPTDILAGILLGLLYGFLAMTILNRLV